MGGDINTHLEGEEECKHTDRLAKERMAMMKVEKSGRRERRREYGGGEVGRRWFRVRIEVVYLLDNGANCDGWI